MLTTEEKQMVLKHLHECQNHKSFHGKLKININFLITPYMNEAITELQAKMDMSRSALMRYITQFYIDLSKILK